MSAFRRLPLDAGVLLDGVPSPRRRRAAHSRLPRFRVPVCPVPPRGVWLNGSGGSTRAAGDVPTPAPGPPRSNGKPYTPPSVGLSVAPRRRRRRRGPSIPPPFCAILASPRSRSHRSLGGPDLPGPSALSSRNTEAPAERGRSLNKGFRSGRLCPPRRPPRPASLAGSLPASCFIPRSSIRAGVHRSPTRKAPALFQPVL